ncbi:MAG: hypothetical protein WCK43_07625 [bacterium]|jgi:hypothetical protein
MDLVTLKKKLSTYESDKGYLKNVGEDVLYEVLVAWENWTGASKDFYRALGFTQRQMACIVGKAKKLKRDGAFGSGEFKQVKIDPVMAETAAGSNPCLGAEITWTNGRVIRFSGVDMLVDFLKKVA